MTLIAVLILFPTPSLHAWGPDAAILAGRDQLRTVAPLVRDASSGSGVSQSDCADGEWGDDEGDNPLLDAPAFPRPYRPGSPPFRRCQSPMVSPPSLRSLHLRC
jgi:hypothetical protein